MNYRIKAENQVLQRQLEEEEREREQRRKDDQQRQRSVVFRFGVQKEESKKKPFTVEDLGLGNASSQAVDGSPATSTPSSDESKGAIRKNTYLDRNKSVSGVFSPIRGDVSVPAGTFYPLTPRYQYRSHDTVLKMILDGIEDDEGKEEMNNNEETKEDDDNNHKTAGQGAESQDLLMLTGPSVLEQTEEETAKKKIKVVKVENEVDPFELGENQTWPRRTRSLTRSQKRKQDVPKKAVRKD